MRAFVSLLAMSLCLPGCGTRSTSPENSDAATEQSESPAESHTDLVELTPEAMASSNRNLGGFSPDLTRTLLLAGTQGLPQGSGPTPMGETSEVR